MPRLSATRLTETSLAKLRAAAGGAEKVHHDAATDHLGIRFRNGRSTFFLWYRTYGRVNRLYLGEWPRPLSLDDARTAIALEIGKVVQGGDPLETRRRQKKEAADAAVGTVEARLKQFVRAKTAERLRTVGEYDRVFANHVLPKWRNRPVSSVTRQDVAQLLDAIADRHSVKLADRVLAYVRAFLLWHAAKYDQ